MNVDKLLDIAPYSINRTEKKTLLNNFFYELTSFHYENCIQYRRILDSLKYNHQKKISYYDIPFLPVRLFKMYDLISVEKDRIVKTMNSSGTSGQSVSKIFLDKNTSLNQMKTLTKIVSTFIGSKRNPMIIIDSPAVLKNRNMFSARGAGILGFSIFGNKKHYILDDKMKLDKKSLIDFIAENKKRRIFVFGFTFMIYEFFIKELKKSKFNIDLSNAVVIHGGGWKKLKSESVSSRDFKKALKELCGINFVYDYYGMVEQTGSIFMECESGYLHASIFSDIIIRRPLDFSIADFGEQGIIQTLSILPKSYPGHSLLTEDEGIIYGEDDCSCGRLGKYFKILGRIKSAEIRGCSDTFTI